MYLLITYCFNFRRRHCFNFRRRHVAEGRNSQDEGENELSVGKKHDDVQFGQAKV